MFKNLFITVCASSMTLFLVTACAEDASQESVTESAIKTSQQDATVMTQPVDFSSPEAVETALQNIREKEGDKAYNTLKNAMQYIMVYDLSVGNNKEKLYKKLDGRTPEQIIAKMKR
jgi:hypothetical protein